MDEKMFTELLESVEQAGAIIRGDIKPAGVYEYEDVDVLAARKKTGLSQVKFARLIGVSPGTYRNWEQGRRRPTGPAAALLRIFEHDPEHAMRALHSF